MSDQYEVSEEKPDHHFRTETPNIIYELLKEKKISPLAFILYSVLKKTAGDYGSCFKTNETLAEECGFSKSTVKTYLKELENVRLPNDQKIIEVFRRTNPNNAPDTNLIKIVDIWRYNGETFRGRLKSKNDSKDSKGGSPKNPPLGRQKTQGGSPKNPKEEPINKIPPLQAAAPENKKNQRKLTPEEETELLRFESVCKSKEIPLELSFLAKVTKKYSLQVTKQSLQRISKRSQRSLEKTPDLEMIFWTIADEENESIQIKQRNQQ